MAISVINSTYYDRSAVDNFGQNKN